MAYCLMAPSHYLNQYWPLINEVLWHSPENNSTASVQLSANITLPHFHPQSPPPQKKKKKKNAQNKYLILTLHTPYYAREGEVGGV